MNPALLGSTNRNITLELQSIENQLIVKRLFRTLRDVYYSTISCIDKAPVWYGP